VSFLIIGGSFVVALLAIIGLVVILRQEQQTQTTSTNPKPVVVEKTTPPAATPAPVKAQEAERVTPVLPASQDSDTQYLTHNEDEHLYDDEHLSLSDGQLHEFAVVLHTLHEQAQELEHRLSILTEMVGRIQHSQNGHINLEEEVYHTQDISSASAK
jgi:hypothetical protein